MSMRRRARGFTLIEVLVALALVATVLGGSLAVLREAIATQRHLEQRLYAQWAADNVLNEFVLAGGDIEPMMRTGEEVVLGQAYSYTLAVSALEDAQPAAPDNVYEVAVDVRGTAGRATSLAHLTRRMGTAP